MLTSRRVVCSFLICLSAYIYIYIIWYVSQSVNRSLCMSVCLYIYLFIWQSTRFSNKKTIFWTVKNLHYLQYLRHIKVYLISKWHTLLDERLFATNATESSEPRKPRMRNQKMRCSAAKKKHGFREKDYFHLLWR